MANFKDNSYFIHFLYNDEEALNWNDIKDNSTSVLLSKCRECQVSVSPHESKDSLIEKVKKLQKDGKSIHTIDLSSNPYNMEAIKKEFQELKSKVRNENAPKKVRTQRKSDTINDRGTNKLNKKGANADNQVKQQNNEELPTLHSNTHNVERSNKNLKSSQANMGFIKEIKESWNIKVKKPLLDFINYLNNLPENEVFQKYFIVLIIIHVFVFLVYLIKNGSNFVHQQDNELLFL